MAAVSLVLPNPEKLDKYLYVRRTPTWLVRAVYAFGLVSWMLVSYAYADAVRYDLFYRYVAAPIVLLLTIYAGLSYVLMLFYKRFDRRRHTALVREFWAGRKQVPVIDVFLPICGEEFTILRNT